MCLCWRWEGWLAIRNNKSASMGEAYLSDLHR